MSVFNKRVFLFTSFFLLLDLYVFGGIQAAFSPVAPALRQLAAVLFWLSQIIFSVWIVYVLLYSSGFKARNQSVIRRLGSISVLVFVPMLIWGLLLLGEDMYRLLRIPVAGIQHLLQHDQTIQMSWFVTRSTLYSQISLMISILMLFIIAYGITRGKHRFKVHRSELFFPDLPVAFDGFQITQLSDIHAGSFDNGQALRDAIALINKQESDVLFFTGDLVNNAASEMEPWIGIFSELRAPMGKFAILGNHDYGDYVSWPSPEAKQANLRQLESVHARIGFELLRNESRKLKRNGSFIDLLGIENWGKSFVQHGDLPKTLESTAPGSFKILLSHDPSHWEEEVMNGTERIQLTLSGHTHGMQFGFELFGFQFSPARLRYKRWAGLYEKNKRFLYVNRGFGFLGFPGRVGIWPEITVLTLRKAKS
jgi:predicted MPP superfamily phosphohydrolase